MASSAFGPVLLLGLLGFVLGYAAAGDRSPERRLLTAFGWGLAVFITPGVIGILGR